MKSLKLISPILGFLSIFILSGCVGSSNSSSGMNAAPQSLSSSGSITDTTILKTSFKIRNDTGKQISKLVVLSNGVPIDTKNLDCVKRCIANIDENKITGNLTFKFYQADGTEITKYVWPYGVGRRFAIGRPQYNDTLSRASAYSNSFVCSATAIDGMFGILSSFASGFPVLSGLLSVGEGVMSDACNGSENLQDAINQLSSRMDLLDSEMKFSIDQMSQETNIKDINSIVTDFTSNILAFQDVTDTYNVIFQGPAENYESMADFVQNNSDFGGDFKKVFDNNVPFKTTITTTKQQVDAFNELLLLKLPQLNADLHAGYDNPNTIVGDVVAGRANGDLIINYLTTKVGIASSQVKLMFYDEINTMLTAIKNKSIDDKWLSDHGMLYFYYGHLGESTENIYIPWESATAFVDNLIDAKVDTVQTTLIGKSGLMGEVNSAPNMFMPLSGFNSDLSASMVAHKCYLPTIQVAIDGKPTMVNQPSVSQWYANPDAPGGPYITTNCFDGESFVKSVYYTNAGNKVVNIMGALMPDVDGPYSVYTNYWPNSFNAGSIQVPASVQSPEHISLTTASFTLNSESADGTSYPIKISSSDKVVRHFEQGIYKNPDLGIVTLGYGTVDSLYKSNDLWKFLTQVNGGQNLKSSFLIPDSTSPKDTFTSVIYNGSDAIAHDDVYYTDELNEIVYLSFEKNGNTYVFGLRIINAGYSFKQVGRVNEFADPSETINLVCLLKGECYGSSTDPRKIEWSDGTSATLIGNGSKIQLVIGSDK